AAIDRLQKPTPRLALGGALVGIASTCIDLSDGLAQDAGHVAAASRMSLHLDARSLPASAAVTAAWADARSRARAMAAGGEDYELLFTAPASRAGAIARLGRRLGLPLTRIGSVRRGRGVHLHGAGAARLQGFDHLA
ncbi:MAG TPA: thiamine-phosphate kinase, partial [Myxococcaceae bacterium]|nr:thiamine-phosphate kinase [Myxococcaceae bacterium]